jgi:hypothetical protein
MINDYMQHMLKLAFEKPELRARELVYHDALGPP